MNDLDLSTPRQGQALTDPGSRIRVFNLTASNGFQELSFNSFRFTGGEVHVKLGVLKYLLRDVFIVAPILNSEDLMAVLLLVDALRRTDAGIRRMELHLPYAPYARQDRVMEKGEALSSKVFTSIINVCKFDCVQVDDPHSDVAPALIENCIIKEQWELVVQLGRVGGADPFSSGEFNFVWNFGDSLRGNIPRNNNTRNNGF